MSYLYHYIFEVPLEQKRALGLGSNPQDIFLQLHLHSVVIHGTVHLLQLLLKRAYLLEIVIT